MSCPVLLQLASAHSEGDENSSLWARIPEEHVVPLLSYTEEKEQLLRTEDTRTHVKEHEDVCEDTQKAMEGDRRRVVHLERRSREAIERSHRSKEQGTKRARHKERQQETCRP